MPGNIPPVMNYPATGHPPISFRTNYPELISCWKRERDSTAVRAAAAEDSYWGGVDKQIDYETNNIYICDGGNDRVQVFDGSLVQIPYSYQLVSVSLWTECLWRRMKLILSLYSLLWVYIYIRIVSWMQRNGELEFNNPTCVAVSTVNSLITFVTLAWYSRIQCLNLNLTFHCFIPNTNHPFDVILTPQSILVLTSGSPCVQLYDYSHQLIREMTDVLGDCVLIFSYRGELLHRFGEREETFVVIVLSLIYQQYILISLNIIYFPLL